MIAYEENCSLSSAKNQMGAKTFYICFYFSHVVDTFHIYFYCRKKGQKQKPKLAERLPNIYVPRKNCMI